jgi:hypothetical protein
MASSSALQRHAIAAFFCHLLSLPTPLPAATHDASSALLSLPHPAVASHAVASLARLAASRPVLLPPDLAFRSSLCPSWPPPRPGSPPASSRLSLRSRHASSAPAPASHPTTLILSPSRSLSTLLLCRHCTSHAIAPRAPFAAALVRPASPLSGAFILESRRAKKHPRASALLPLPPLPPRRGPHRQ